jgi:hypothetical protein
MDARDAEALELIAESPDELAEVCAFIESAGLELVAVVAFAVPRPSTTLAVAPTQSAA